MQGPPHGAAQGRHEAGCVGAGWGPWGDSLFGIFPKQIYDIGSTSLYTSPSLSTYIYIYILLTNYTYKHADYEYKTI